jgi:hypothetical protein
MVRLFAWVLASALGLMSVAPAPAQDRARPGAGQGGRSAVLVLAGQKSVQAELKLSDDQVKKVTAIRMAMREKVQDITETDVAERMKKAMAIFKEAEADVFAVLKPDQARRLRQIALQQQPLARALENPEVARGLNLSQEQAKEVRAIREGTAKEIGKVSEGAQSRPEVRKKTDELIRASEAKALQVLTAEQKTKWKELLGPPFTGELQRGAGPGAKRDRKEP